MDMKVYKIFEIGYLIIAAFFTYKSIITFSVDSKKASLYLFFAIIAVCMYFFKKWFRKKRFENKE